MIETAIGILWFFGLFVPAMLLLAYSFVLAYKIGGLIGLLFYILFVLWLDRLYWKVKKSF